MIGFGFKIGKSFLRGGLSNLSNETIEYLERLSIAGGSITEEQTLSLDSMIVSLKQEGVWGLLDEVYCFGGNTLAAQKVKLKYAQGNSSTLTTFNMSDSDASMTGGFGPGSLNTNKFATTGYVPSNFSRTYTNFHFACSFLGQPNSGNGNGHFLVDTPVSTIFKANIGSGYGGLYPTISNSANCGAVSGFHCYSLSASGQRRSMDDAIMDLSTHALTPTFPTQFSLFRSAFNNVTDFAAGKMGFACLGASLTSDQQRTLGNAVRTLEYAWGRRSAPNGRIGFLGDSITQGFNASPIYTTRFSSQVASNIGMVEINLGVQGGKLMGSLASSGVVRYADLNRASVSKAVLMLGTNDASAAYSSQFLTDYNTILSGLIAGGLTADNIVVCSLPYCTDTTSRPLARQEAYANAAEEAANTFGCRFVDVYSFTLANPSYIHADTIHLTSIGHGAVATLITNSL